MVARCHEKHSLQPNTAFSSRWRAQNQSAKASEGYGRGRLSDIACPVARGRSPYRFASAEWQLALDLIAWSQSLQCSCDAVERIPSAERGQAVQFVPIHFVFRNKLTRHDKLLLAFDALVLSKALGREVTLGRIVHGDNHVVAEGERLGHGR
jgi:hypothetical protein